MGKQRMSFRPPLRLAAVAAIATSLAACVGPPTAAPVYMRGGAGDMTGDVPLGAVPRASYAPSHERSVGGREIIVRPGQSIGRLAQEYRVSERAIVAANHLSPPYKIETGQRLVIPGAVGQPSLAAASPENNTWEPEVIPLDGPSPKSTQRPTSQPVTPQGVATTPPANPSATEQTHLDPAQHAASLPHGGQLPWPVRGHILAGYGVGTGGRHNDGINIAAARGEPVRAVDGGVVAYAGNELRGYGNLVLIKHPDGFISAYAHCEELLVKRGDRVARGQIIGKVGATGGVGEPQLHFELRRGEHAVDPREFLAPAPSADSRGISDHG